MIDYFKSQHMRVKLIPSISLVEDGEDAIALVSEYGRVPFKEVGRGIVKAFHSLARGDKTEAELAKEVLELDGLGGLTRFNFYYAQCVFRCFVEYSVYMDDARLMSLMLTVPVRSFNLAELETEKLYALSRFAYCHKEDGGLSLETPLFGSKVMLEDWRAAAFLQLLHEPRSAREITESASFINSDCAEAMLKLLIASKAVTDEEENSTLRQWDFQDLLFHSRTRMGRHNNSLGATFRFLGQLQPQPLLKP
ncbi:MAG: hypothetical protein JOZ52_03940, partial [Acidobacteria bacterium]|nr:hypothetical protein [Acidobacteriota bacterium]